MKKSKIQIVIVFSIFALIGSIAVQYYWVSELYQQNRILLDQNMNRALKYAVNKIQKEEDKYRIQQSISQPAIYANNLIKVPFNKDEKQEPKKNRTKLTIHAETKNTHQKHKNQNKTIPLDMDSALLSVDIDKEWYVFTEDSFETSFQIKIEGDSIVQSFESKADSLIQLLEYKTFDIKKEQEELESTIDRLVWEIDDWSSPFYDSIPSGLIQEVLSETFSEYGLPASYEFAIISGEEFLFESKDYDTEDVLYKYITSLYPDYLIPRQQMLVVQLASNVMYRKITVPVLLSILFTLMLAIGLWLIIRNMLHHRNISQVQNDFINNMTHEFKTPIATISLASDSILKPSILDQQDKVSYFTGMIKKENKRMNRLVEKILQMARLENKEFKLEKQKVDVHEMIEMISENTKIKLKDKGDIELQLNAHKNELLADQVHLTNVFYNLLDNAIKYAEEPIHIIIQTLNLKNQLIIRLKDNGQGMNKKDLQHIFDRFYRVEVGNVHNTKGYGLGLTYVRAVIEKHNGQINVKSEIGVGSTFEVKLPI